MFEKLQIHLLIQTTLQRIRKIYIAFEKRFFTRRLF